MEQVLLVASPIDLSNCGGGRSSFDIAVADRFVFDGSFPAQYYATYFDPFTFAGNAKSIKWRRQNVSSFEALAINGFGDGPIEPSASRGLHYGDVKLDRQCFASLRRMALQARDKNIRLSVVLTPLSQAWRSQYDVGGRITGTMRRNIDAALTGTGGTLLQPDFKADESAFFDAIHIRWSQTPRFTNAILDELQGPVPAR